MSNGLARHPNSNEAHGRLARNREAGHANRRQGFSVGRHQLAIAWLSHAGSARIGGKQEIVLC
jgi:hypothetical protein